MARSAVSALVAAVEIYNKPTVEYREQTFAVLVINAWEVLLKARIVQQNGNKLASIIEREQETKRYLFDDITGGQSTIGLKAALSTVSLSPKVKRNIAELVNVRNEAMHMGLLTSDLRDVIHRFGAASVQNFNQVVKQWFDEDIHVSYLLPVGFFGKEKLAVVKASKGQRALLERLRDVSAFPGSDDDDFAVALSIDININPKMTGGGTIGPTNDPRAPRTNLTTDQILELYPASYDQIREMCKGRYEGFKANRKFNDLMTNAVKPDPNCTFGRPNNPKNPNSLVTYYHNDKQVLKILDEHYDIHDVVDGTKP